MGMWIAILVLVCLALLICLIFLSSRFGRMIPENTRGFDRKWKRFLAGVGVTIVICVMLTQILNLVNMIICMLHLAVFWMLFEAAGVLIRKFTGKNNVKRKLIDNSKTNCTSINRSINRSINTNIAESISKTIRHRMLGAISILFTAVYLAAGWYIDHHAVETHYSIGTQKEIGEELRIVMFADSHMGAVFHADRFAEYLQEIRELEPDVLLISGDYVDDDTSKEDMVMTCEALGKLQTTYGIYFVFGNHDKGYFRYKNFTTEELVNELSRNQVMILEDQSVLVNDSFYIVGRADRSNRDRQDMSELTKGLDPDKYMIVLDHQPYDYQAEAEYGADLVLSGHTHGGQLFPFNRMGQWTGVDAKSYGWERRDGTDFIVTSGIADWAIKFKTGCVSEYVVIDVSTE